MKELELLNDKQRPDEMESSSIYRRIDLFIELLSISKLGLPPTYPHLTSPHLTFLRSFRERVTCRRELFTKGDKCPRSINTLLERY